MKGKLQIILYFLTAILLPTAVYCQVPSPEVTKRAVLHILTDEGTCNGVLLNHPDSDQKVYVLTAAHCVRQQNKLLGAVIGRDHLTDNEVIRSVEWQSKSLTEIARSEDLDYLLLELTDPFPDHIFPYFAGWEAKGGIPPAAYSIHAPGSTKLFAEDLNSPELATFEQIADFGGNPVTDGTYRIGRWEQGNTAAGSSGAPLFDNFSRVKGILSGGSSTEALPVNDFFSRFDLMYEDGLKALLDPGNESDNSFDGLDFTVSQKALFKAKNYRSSDDFMRFISNAMVSEHFTNNDQVTIDGVFLASGQVVPTDIITVSIISSEQIVYQQEVFSGELSAFSENFIELDEDVTVIGDYSVMINHNNSLQFPLLLTVGSKIALDGRETAFQSLMISTLASGISENGFTEEPPGFIYPNPSTQNFYLSPEATPFVDEIRVYTADGRQVQPEITIDYLGRVVINMTFFKKGMYFIKYQTPLQSFFDRLLLF